MSRWIARSTVLGMRILAVDHGQARIGLAISDLSGVVARPLEVITHQSRHSDAKRVATIAIQNGVGLILVGLPIDPHGHIGSYARTVLRFGKTLQAISTLPVKYWDESFSTKTAAKLLRDTRQRSRPKIDAAAAAITLQDYLDAHAPQSH